MVGYGIETPSQERLTMPTTPNKPKPFYPDDPVADYGIEVPAWIDDAITWNDVDAIVKGGCASGAYMPAVTYSDAMETMRLAGDEVLQYIEDNSELPDVSGESWSGMACKYLSTAVELWACGVQDDWRSVVRDREASIEEWEDTHGWEAPSHWASYLINGDHSGLDDEEKAQADAFIDTVVKDSGHAHFCDVVERGYTRHGDYAGHDVSMYILAH